MGEVTPSAPTVPRRDRRVALWLAVVASLAYLPLNHCHFSGSDETGVFEPARALYETGSMAIAPGKHIFQGQDGNYYSHFAIGQSLLALPFIALSDLLSTTFPELTRRLTQREPGTHIDSREDPATFLVSAYAPLASGILVALFFWLERSLGASRRAALFASLLLGASTYVASHSVFFLRHTSEAVAILGAFAGFHAWKRGGRLTALALGSLCATAILLIRVPAVIAAPALAGYLLFVLSRRLRAPEERSRLLGIVLAIGIPVIALGAIHFGVNHSRWGMWLRSPMVAQSPLLQGSLASGLRGLLLSPGASLFVYSPLLLLLPLTLPPFWRSRRAECVTTLAIAVSFLWLCGSFYFWHGLWSAPGPRYLFALTPLLLLPLGPWLDRPRPSWQRVAVVVLGAVGVVIQLALVTAHWRRTAERMGYIEQIQTLEFLFEPARIPIVGALRSVAAGEIDLYLWSLWHGVPGRAAQPGLTLALLLVWAVLIGASLYRLQAAARSDGAETVEGEGRHVV